MPTFLSMDGVDDYILTPSMTFTKVILDATFTSIGAINTAIIDTRKDFQAYAFANGASNNKYNFLGFNLYEDGVVKSTNESITLGKRLLFEASRGTAITTRVNIFSDNNNSRVLKGQIYDIKFYNGVALVAHYDMSTGTMQDQSGNGNHATMVGGTWINDSPVGVDVSYAYATRQVLKANLSAQFTTVQKVYSGEQQIIATKQSFHNSRTDAYATKQSIHESKQYALTLRQQIYAIEGTDIDTLQIVFADRIALNQMIQRIYTDKDYMYPLLINIVDYGESYEQTIYFTVQITRKKAENIKIKRSFNNNVQLTKDQRFEVRI